jgi:hypothetical protein
MKTTVLRIGFLLITTYSIGQNWEWIKTAGGGGPDLLAGGIAVNKKGEIFIAGHVVMGCIYSPNCLGYSDIFIAKYDKDGNLLWAKRAGSVDNQPWVANDAADGIGCDEDGNAYLVCDMKGQSPTFDTIVFPNATSSKFFLAKYSPNGKCLWARYTYGAYVYSISASKNSVFVSSVGNIGNFFVRYRSKDGSEHWKKSIINGYVVNFITDGKDNCFLSGVYNDSTTIDTIVLKGGYTFIAKLDSSGNVVWAKNSTGGYLIFDKGSLYSLGTFKNTLNICNQQLISSGSYDILLSRYDENGNCKWVKKIGGTGNEVPKSYNSLNNSFVGYGGGVMILARSNASYSLETCEVNLPDSGAYILKIDSNGICQSVKILPNIFNNGCIGADTSQNVYLAGDYWTPLAFDSFTITPISNPTDIFIAKLNTNVTNVPEQTNKNGWFFNIYPNPSDGTYHLDISVSLLPAQLEIYDALGKNIFLINISQENTFLNIPELAKGVYLFKVISSNGNTFQQKIIR